MTTTRDTTKRGIELFQHAMYLMQSHGWTSEQTIVAIRYYEGDLTLDDMRWSYPQWADQIVAVR
jgi:hypothetical protein